MKRQHTKNLWVSLGALTAFALWTLLVCRVDVQPIGPGGSLVGLAAVNQAFHTLTEVHWLLYTLTDWLGLIPLAIVLGFAVLGLVQLIGRRSLLRVDRSILVLGGFYIVVLGAYLLFETAVINYRPVLIEGNLESSYPSSTTMLALCVLPTAIMQLRPRIRSNWARRMTCGILAALTAFMVAGRLLSGVHWLSDIVGGILISVGLVALYAFAVSLREDA